MTTQQELRTGQIVRVPNGELGIIVELFRKDGEDRVVVEFRDGTWLTISPLDVTVKALPAANLEVLPKGVRISTNAPKGQCPYTRDFYRCRKNEGHDGEHSYYTTRI